MCIDTYAGFNTLGTICIFESVKRVFVSHR